MTTIGNAQKTEEASFSLTTCVCLVCKNTIEMIETAVFSRRNKAFLHYECRDSVFAKRAEKARVQGSTLTEDCVACGEPVDLAEECLMSGGRAWHMPCRPTAI